MSVKSDNKKLFILKKAREVFCERGFLEVTMKDIVEACDISRGGLYLYYGSTDEIFAEVLRLEGQDTDEGFDEAISENSTITEILGFFLKEQKKELLQKTNTLTIATYEYFFKNKVPRKDNTLRRTFDDAVRVLSDLIAQGVATGEFYCNDPKAAARNIMFILEGLRVCSNTMDIDRKMVDEQLVYIMDGLLSD